MKFTIKNTCPKPRLEIINDEVFCFNYYGLYQKMLKFTKTINQLII